ncbi:MAG: PTS glucose transporter subunit IIA, partial [Parafannyhessea umbonata]|nr:PTS glucose transporter subunit IIA [Parafannyhessea umbonata]
TAKAYFREKQYQHVRDSIGAKTGTAQVTSIDLENNAWFVMLAPFESETIDGVVTVTAGTRHAIGVTDEKGADVLVHIGVDTVSLRGSGFAYFVRKGDRVRAGQALMSFDPELIRKSGLDSHVVVVVTNTEDLAAVTPVVPGMIDAGDLAIAIEY